MNYTLHQLAIFQKVVELKSVTRAAEVLHLTQPAVSIQLKNFQDQFEIPLTEVVGRQLYVTEFGHDVAKAAEAILAQMTEINYKAMAFKGQVVGKLKVSVVSTGKYLMPYFLTGFINQYPGVDLSMTVTNKQLVVQSIRSNEVDFALVSIIPENLACDSMELLENRLYMVGNRPFPQEKGKSLVEILDNMPLIYREEGSGTRQIMETFLRSQNLDYRKKMELTSNEAVKQAVLAGLGVSIMPLIGLRNEIQNGSLHLWPVPGLPLGTRWSLVWAKEKKLAPVAKAYLKFLEAQRDAIIASHFDWYEKFK